MDVLDARGIVLESGERLDADIIVTATGLHLQENMPMNSMAVTVRTPFSDPYIRRARIYKSRHLETMHD